MVADTDLIGLVSFAFIRGIRGKIILLPTAATSGQNPFLQ
jgi:hypothetical protein